jgi:hypothetical protein
MSLFGSRDKVSYDEIVGSRPLYLIAIGSETDIPGFASAPLSSVHSLSLSPPLPLAKERQLIMPVPGPVRRASSDLGPRYAAILR